MKKEEAQEALRIISKGSRTWIPQDDIPEFLEREGLLADIRYTTELAGKDFRGRDLSDRRSYFREAMIDALLDFIIDTEVDSETDADTLTMAEAP